MSKKIQNDSTALLKLNRIVCYVILILLVLLCLFPFYILIVNTTRSNPEIMKGFSLIPGKSLGFNYKSLIENKNLPVYRGIINSTFIATCTALFTTYFSTMTAYAFHAYRFKFKNAIFAFILMIMMIPTQVSALGFIRLITKMNMIDTFYPLILPSIASPVVFFFMIQYMKNTMPIEIIEASRIDGANEFYTFNRIVVPIMKPAIAVQAIFAFVNSWNNYFIPALILETANKKTLPILIAQLRSADFLKFDLGQVYMLISVAIVPVIIVYLILSKYIVRGVALGSVKG